MEIERKWLVDIKQIPFDLKEYAFLDIEQAYLCFKPTLRIRKLANKNQYILTMKSSSWEKGIVREEYEINISKEEYENLLMKVEGNIIKKRRYLVPIEDYLMEIDLFKDKLEGLAYMEIEFKTIEEAKTYIAPTWVKKELSDDHRYSNASLARLDYDQIRKEFDL